MENSVFNKLIGADRENITAIFNEPKYFRELQAYATRIIRDRLGSRRADYEDIVAIALGKFYTSLAEKHFRPANPAALTRMFRNVINWTAVDWLRKELHREKIAPTMPIAELDEVENSTDLQTEYITQEEINMVAQAVDRVLTDSQKEALRIYLTRPDTDERRLERELLKDQEAGDLPPHASKILADIQRRSSEIIDQKTRLAVSTHRFMHVLRRYFESLNKT